MLFNVVYKNASDVQSYVTMSGNNMSSVIVYCDSNNLTPLQILNQTFNLVLNNPSLTKCYLVTLKDNVTQNPTTTMVYDTYSGLNSWIASQTDKSVINLALLDRPFIQA